MLRSVENSLERIGVDRIDLLFLHDAEEHFDDALREGYPALAELRAQGMVGATDAETLVCSPRPGPPRVPPSTTRPPSRECWRARVTR